MNIRSRACAAMAAAALALGPAVAQDYPNRPVRIVVGFAAGSVSDLVARAIGQKLGSMFPQPFVVEVRPGAGSNVAAQYVARAPKDGHTLFVTTSSSTIRGPGSANLGFDFSTDFAPIALVAGVPFVFTTYPGLGVKSVEAFIALAKSNQQALTFGATAVGTSGYLAAQLFNQRAGISIPIAPYPSTAQATTDLMTGRISIAVASAANVFQLIEDGKLTALAVAQPQRAAMMPSLPTIDEAGLRGIHAESLDRAPGPGRDTERRRDHAVAGDQRVGSVQRFRASPAIAGTGSQWEAVRKICIADQDTARWDAVLQTEQLAR